MKMIETDLTGAFLIEPERRTDERGFFARTFCREEFREQGIEMQIVQCNVSHNRRRGTLRGMHYQIPPCAEQKLVCCPRGAVFDVIVDLRTDSATCGAWFGVELSAVNRRTLYIPSGMAHGFQTLADDTEVFYQMGQEYSPEHARGFRYDDPAVGIDWPLPVACISSRDENFGPAFSELFLKQTAECSTAAVIIDGANR